MNLIEKSLHVFYTKQLKKIYKVSDSTTMTYCCKYQYSVIILFSSLKQYIDIRKNYIIIEKLKKQK